MAHVYCNGHYMPENEASISIFDRGFLFADAIYEVTAILGGRMIDNDLHLQRLQRSLGEINIPLPMPLSEIEAIQRELIARNKIDEGIVYLQISRGVAKRDFFYADTMKPSFIAFTNAVKLLGTKAQTDGIAVMLAPDPRWVRRDIKSVMLLGQVMAKQAARAAGFDDVWLVQDGMITEGASASALIITPDNTIITRPNSHSILPGCTRRAVMRLCQEKNIKLEERAFSPQEAQEAAEAFLTSASGFVTPVVRIDQQIIGNGQPGPLTRRLQKIYLDTVTASKS
ncbi:D-amino-acid transaminase [Aquamicrobium segne]|uniref:Probable branched-chain-amino-acid aminotransferase n=1 Tax=Aquamicrobium segne TaxID=469547 RepID=A0ABW0GT65_9HYPH